MRLVINNATVKTKYDQRYLRLNEILDDILLVCIISLYTSKFITNHNHNWIRFATLGPLVNSEYYPGWLDYWGVHHHTQAAQVSAKSFDDYLGYQNASVSVYMAHGGTSFGFEAGKM